MLRFIYDLCPLNDNFEKISKEIYPPELAVSKRQNPSNLKASYLDLDIIIKWWDWDWAIW